MKISISACITTKGKMKKVLVETNTQSPECLQEIIIAAVDVARASGVAIPEELETSIKEYTNGKNLHKG